MSCIVDQYLGIAEQSMYWTDVYHILIIFFYVLLVALRNDAPVNPLNTLDFSYIIIWIKLIMDVQFAAFRRNNCNSKLSLGGRFSGSRKNVLQIENASSLVVMQMLTLQWFLSDWSGTSLEIKNSDTHVEHSSYRFVS